MVKELKINLLCLNSRMDNLYSLKMALLHTFLHLTKVSIEIYKYYSINDSFFLQMCMNNWKKNASFHLWLQLVTPLNAFSFYTIKMMAVVIKSC